MGLALHQSGHGHSHGRGHSHGNQSHEDSQRQEENPSVRAAFIHVIGDLLQSLGVLVAAYIIYFKVRAGSWEGGGQYLGLLCTGLFPMLGPLQLGMRGWREGRNM